MFFVQHQCFGFQKTQVEKHQFLVKRGVATKRLFNNLCFAQCAKLSFFPFFGQILVDVHKNTIKIGISAHFQKQKRDKKDHFEGLLSGPSKGYYLGQVCCNIKMANLAQIITLQIFAHLFSKEKC